LRWAFAPKRIAEKAGWARSAYERRGGSVVLTRTQRVLMSKWAAMQAEVLRGTATPAEAAAAYFPDGAYERLVAKAQQEAQREQAQIDTDMAAGKYLW